MWLLLVLVGIYGGASPIEAPAREEETLVVLSFSYTLEVPVKKTIIIEETDFWGNRYVTIKKEKKKKKEIKMTKEEKKGAAVAMAVLGGLVLLGEILGD